MARTYILQGMKRDTVLQIAGISKHQYYYRPLGTRGGRQPILLTPLLSADGSVTQVEEKQVVEQIKSIKTSCELEDYGYRKVCIALMMSGLMINHKKVYRIMSEYQLLNDRHQRPSRQYAKYRKVCPEGPLQVIEMDIKFQWVEEHSRHCYILTILDTFTRAVLHWELGYTMKQAQVKRAWEEVIATHLQGADMLSKGISIEIRNDNGSQFAAKTIQEFFKENHLNQVFTHPYTPQENGHIESFHSILGRSLDRKRFLTFRDLERHLKLFYRIYNDQRLHGSIAILPPRMFWQLWNQNLITRTVVKNNQVKFKLKIPYQKLSGIGKLKGASCYSLHDLDGHAENQKKVVRPDTPQPSVQRSPSVASC
ncbi:MAG: DDE-type integrase/transposase/recombinase [Sediminibacterium sp.]